MARRRRLSTSLATIIVLAGAGGLSWMGAEAAATFVEDRAARDVTQALQAAGHDWAQVATDGLRVRLTGTAPSEVERFRAVTQAGTAVDATRILDEMTVASVEAMTPPDFKVELLKGEQGLSLIGLVPAATDRDAILRGLRPAGQQVTDLMEARGPPRPRRLDRGAALRPAGRPDDRAGQDLDRAGTGAGGGVGRRPRGSGPAGTGAAPGPHRRRSRWTCRSPRRVR